MENRRINFLLGMMLTWTFISQSVMAASPGEELLNDESRLRARIENMTTEIIPFYNAEVKRRLSFMVKTKPEFTEPMLGRMVQYYPYIDSLLAANGLPIDLKYITVIESSLKPEVHSYAGAGGLWQFMRATGRSFGLQVNHIVDERLDPYRASQAAVNYLKYLYEIYDDWTLVLMAYNCGPGRLNRAMKLADGKTYQEIAPYLPRETREYIPKYIAASFFMKNYEIFGFTPEWPSMDKQLVSRIKVYERISLKETSEFTGINLELLKEMNPALKQNYIPQNNNGYYLNVPLRFSNATYSFLSEYADNGVDAKPLDIQYLSPRVESEDSTNLDGGEYYFSFEYRVKAGDSWKSIARIFDLNLYHLKYWNNNYNRYLYSGQMLTIQLPDTERNRAYAFILSRKEFDSLKKRAYLVKRSKEPEWNFPYIKLINEQRKIAVSEIVHSLEKGNFLINKKRF